MPGLPFTRLAVYKVAYCVDSHDDMSQRQAKEYAAQIEALLSAGPSRRCGRTAHDRGDADGDDRAAAGAPMWPALESDAPTLAYDSTITGHAELGAALSTERMLAVAVSTLVVAGGASPDKMCAAAQRLARALPDGRLRVLQGQTHDVQAKL